MPLSFKVGGSDDPDATSYASVADYLSVNDERGIDGTDLTTVDQDEIKRHLNSATRFIDMKKWKGEPKHQDNVRRLGLPTYGLVVGPGNPHYREGDSLPDDEIPWVVVRAVCLLAEEERYRGTPLWRPEVDRRKLLSRKRSITGSTKEYSDPTAPRRYPAVEALLRGLHRGTFGTSRKAVPI